MSVAMPDTDGFRVAFQALCATVHGGKHFPNMLALINIPPGDKCGLHNPEQSPSYRTPWDWALPQLTQVQMVRHNMAGHAGDDDPPTIRT